MHRFFFENHIKQDFAAVGLHPIIIIIINEVLSEHAFP